MYVKNFDFDKYIQEHLGPRPYDGWHAHHILMKGGNGEKQQALVREGQAILREAGIHPVFGLENFVWAPMRVKGQHHITSLTEVVESLKNVKANKGSYRQYVEALRKLGKTAARR